jgi:hypothetical protein
VHVADCLYPHDSLLLAERGTLDLRPLAAAEQAAGKGHMRVMPSCALLLLLLLLLQCRTRAAACCQMTVLGSVMHSCRVTDLLSTLC